MRANPPSATRGPATGSFPARPAIPCSGVRVTWLVLAAGLAAGCAWAPVRDEQREGEPPVSESVRLEVSFVEMPAKEAYGVLGGTFALQPLVQPVDRRWAEDRIEAARKGASLRTSPAMLLGDGETGSIANEVTIPCLVDVLPAHGELEEQWKELSEGVTIVLTPEIRPRQVALDLVVTVSEVRRPIGTFTTDVRDRRVTIQLPQIHQSRMGRSVSVASGGYLAVGTYAPRGEGDERPFQERALLGLVRVQIVDLPDDSGAVSAR